MYPNPARRHPNLREESGAAIVSPFYFVSAAYLHQEKS
jgi:hypothetical protein